jgi:predicted transcriptional regulator
VKTKEDVWTFLSNHTHVLICLAKQPDLQMRAVAQQVGITERAVQRIVKELSASGVLRLSKMGRRNHYHVNRELPLRHPLESHHSIGDLLDAVK